MKRNALLCGIIGLLCSFFCVFAQDEMITIRPEPEQATIAVQVGTVGEHYASEHYPKAKQLPYDNLQDAVIALLAGKADYVITARTNCLNFSKANPGKLLLLPEKLTDEGAGIAINKSETDLMEKINSVLDQFRSDGRLDRLIANWIREDGSAYIQDEIPRLSDAPVLDVAVSAEREPLCYVQDGKITGMDAELIQRIAYELGMQVKFHDMKYAAMIPSVLSGKTPVAISNISATAERREMVNFSTEYFFNPQTLLTRAEATTESAQSESVPSGGPSLESFATKRFGVISGAMFDQIVGEHLPQAELFYYTNYSDLILALNQNKIDAFTADQPIARELLRTNDQLVILNEMLMPDEYGFAFPKTDAGAKLRDEFNQFMQSASDGKLLQELDAIWYGDDETSKIMPHAESLPATNGTVRYAATMGYPPFCYFKDEQPVGLEVDLITRFCQHMGYGLVVNTSKFDGLISGLVSGYYDAVSSNISITEERKKQIHFSGPYYEGGIVVVTKNVNAVLTNSESTEEIGFFAALADSFKRNFLVENRWKLIVDGIGVTLLLSICSGILGILIGFGMCLLRMQNNRAVDAILIPLTRVLQGTPMVVLLMVFYYIIFNKSGLSGIVVACITFGLNFGAYSSEIMLAGIKAVSDGQREAAIAIGFSPSQAFRKIIFPQAARQFLPVLKGEYISLVKMTSIVGYVAVQDLTKASDIIRSRTYDAFFPLIVSAMIYFLLSFGLSSLLKLIEVRIDPKHRARIVKGVKTA